MTEVSEEFYNKFVSVFKLGFNGRKITTQDAFNAALDNAASQVKEDFPKAEITAIQDDKHLIIYGDQSPFINSGDAHSVKFVIKNSRNDAAYRYLFVSAIGSVA